MNSIKIGEYKKCYLDEVNSILKKDINYISRISSGGRNLLLFEDRTIIGIGSIWDNVIHPYREYISIYIVPDKRNNGLGKLLFHELESRYKLKKMQTAFDSSNINANSFALKCGFQLIRKSHCYNVNKVELKPFNGSIKVETMKLYNLSEAHFEDTIAFQYEDYKFNHKRVNPLSENIKIEEWKKIISCDLVKKDSYVFVKDNYIHAYLLCYETDKSSIEIGYTGSRFCSIEVYKTFLYKVIRELFLSYNKIELEVDDSDPGASILAQLFCYRPNQSWDAYIKDN